MKAFAKTDLGKTREMNQDFYFMSEPDAKIKLFILADGMGGYKGGEVASKLAVNSVKSYVENNFELIKYDREAICDLLKSAIEYANMVVYEKSKQDQELSGMGTTLDVCLIYNNKLYIGHVGDSRVYRIRKEIFRKLTVDHSYVESLVKDGTITREEAENHPKKNMLTKALGCTAYVEPDIYVRGLVKDDVLLMSSDGLTNMVKEPEIMKTVKENAENAVDVLVNKANEAGGLDNITVIIIIPIE